MASVSNDGRGKRRILFMAGDGSRKAIRLGKVSKSQAEKVRGYVESLIGGLITGAAVDDETSRWLAALPDTLHNRLAAVGLVKSRTRQAARHPVARTAVPPRRAAPVSPPVRARRKCPPIPAHSA